MATLRTPTPLIDGQLWVLMTANVICAAGFLWLYFFGLELIGRWSLASMPPEPQPAPNRAVALGGAWANVPAPVESADWRLQRRLGQMIGWALLLLSIFGPLAVPIWVSLKGYGSPGHWACGAAGCFVLLLIAGALAGVARDQALTWMDIATVNTAEGFVLAVLLGLIAGCLLAGLLSPVRRQGGGAP